MNKCHTGMISSIDMTGVRFSEARSLKIECKGADLLSCFTPESFIAHESPAGVRLTAA